MARSRKGKWIRRSESEWRLLLARFGTSGLGVEAFCRREAISAASFYRWRGVLSDGHDGGDDIHSDQAAAFVDLGALNSATPPRPRLELKLDLGRRPDPASGAWLMFFPEGQVRVHVYGRPVDMRKSFEGVYALTRQELGQDPLSGRLFVFINRRARPPT